MEKDFFICLDDCGLNRLCFYRKLDESGNIKVLKCQYESFIDGEWFVVVHYDCSLGRQFKRIVVFPNGNTEKNFIAIEDLSLAFKHIMQDIRDKWQFYLSGYISMRKQDGNYA